ncbi:growth hormone releasing hormone [Turdus rufiventris]|nr:growth hormone releasing hormone [Turdus rufiventris]
MLDKATVLLFLHLVTCSISSPLYPALRYSPGPVAGKALSFHLQHSSSLQSHSPLAEEQQEEGLLTDPTEKRMQRHADAIFTDNYRKFLGQISARKFLQTIIGKRLGPQDMDSSRLEGFPSTLAKLIIIQSSWTKLYSEPFTTVKTLPDVSSWKLMHTLLRSDQRNAVLKH